MPSQLLHRIPKLEDVILPNVFLVIILLTTIVYKDHLIHGEIAFKSIWLIILTGFIVIISPFKKHQNKICINQIDYSIFAMQLYIILHNLISHFTYTLNSSFEEFGLLIVYVWIKFYCQKNIGALNSIIYLIVILLIVQTFQGIMQLADLANSFNDSFKVSGFLFNPGPYAILLSSLSVFVVVSADYFSSILAKIGVAVLLAMSLLVIFCCDSRAAWIGMSTAIALRICNLGKDLNLKVFIGKSLRLFGVILSVIVTVSVLFLLYNYKRDSSDGHLLISRVCINMIKDHPFVGIGQNGIRSSFLSYQSDFFRHNPAYMTSMGMRADEVAYANNEFLQLLCEHGLLGFFLFINVLNRLRLSFFSFRGKVSNENHLYFAAILSIVVIITSGMFSYPLSVLPIKLIFLFFIAIVSSFETTSNNKQNLLALNFNRISTITRICSCLIGVLLIMYGGLIFFANRQEYLVREDIRSADRIRQLEKYNFLLKYDYWYIILESGYFIRVSQLDNAIAILRTGEQYCPDKNMYYTLGNIYAAQHNFRGAEQQYQIIYFALPNLVTPKYLLAKLYYQSGQTLKWIKFGKEVINSKPKIQNVQIEKMQDEIKNIFLINRQEIN